MLSLAGLLRSEFDSRSVKEMTLRTAVLFRLAAKLKWLSDIFRLCVVVVNQVTAFGPGLPLDQGGGSSGVTPAMGMAWSHCVNARIMLHKHSPLQHSLRAEGDEEEDRHAQVVGGSIAPRQPAITSAKIGESYFIADDSSETETSSASQFSRKRLHELVQYPPQGLSESEDTTGCASKRLMVLKLSPCHPSGSCSYKIVTSGVVGDLSVNCCT